ncbi:hypothetical protein [Gymnodinialimonas hymeniacidonis]|uniref:hypothetical protein n=1 Tax=Gymnodinialimonas hymeniacidonis TaxID=3126508 RepID=UPI0034C677A1
MKTALKSFLSNESGAVSTDWIVLTAVVMGLALVFTAVIVSGTENASNDISNYMANVQTDTDPLQANVDITASTDIALN